MIAQFDQLPIGAGVPQAKAMTADLFWTGLARLSSGSGLLDDWRWAFETGFDNARPFLRPTIDHDQAVPCRRRPPCGCRHAVFERRPELVAVCACEPCDCPPFAVEISDTLVYKLAWDKLGPAIAKALELGPTRPPQTGTPPDPALIEIGVWGRRQWPVFVSLARSRKLWQPLEHRRHSFPGGFVLLAPIERTNQSGWQEFLSALGGVEVSLSRLLRVRPGGRFAAVESLDSMLRAWRPSPALREAEALAGVRDELKALRGELRAGPRAGEPLPDDVAGQLFATIRNLENPAHWQKAPLLQIFRLYCLESLPAAEVAKRCGCAKSLVIERLRYLRQKLGRDPTELRAYSSQFERIEESLSDSRARRIYRPSALDTPDDDDDSE